MKFKTCIISVFYDVNSLIRTDYELQSRPRGLRVVLARQGSSDRGRDGRCVHAYLGASRVRRMWLTFFEITQMQEEVRGQTPDDERGK